MSQYPDSPNASICEETWKLLRFQRHDFLNHLQVIHSYIRLNRLEEAVAYIEKISYDDNWIANVINDYNKREEV
jgi:sensor histidine kinase regulating citrate/malate metabolism